MIRISESRKREIFNNFKNRRILVVGDLMLDRYLIGRVSRISPEAPVPVVEIEQEMDRLGGAANVIHNLKMLKAESIPIGILGADDDGQKIKAHFNELDCNTEGLIIDESRPTSVKTRIIAHNQHVVRADRESKEYISTSITKELLQVIEKLMPTIDGIILEDYNKGLLSAEFISSTISLARHWKKVITVDPKFDNFFAYKDVTVFKPNKKEAESALGRRIYDESDFETTCRLIRDKLNCENVLITLGDRGMCLLESDDHFSLITTKALQVHDVSGAGDTVISTLTLALAAGASVKEATTIANYAAGVVVSEVGAVPIYFDQLYEAVQ